MTSWIFAVVVLLLAIAVAWRLHASGVWKRRCEEATLALHQIQECMEQQRQDAELGRLLGDVGAVLSSEQAMSVPPPEVLVSALMKYRQRAHDYDSAVQYCLQPVELIPAADEDDLERLMVHMNNARKRLFSARAALVGDDMLRRLPELLGGIREAGPEDALIGALHCVATAGRHNQAIELGELLSSAVILTQIRLSKGSRLETEFDDLPVLPPWPWLAPSLLRLLRLAMHQVTPGGTAKLVASNLQQHVELQFTGACRSRAKDPVKEETGRALEDLCRHMDERHISMELLHDDPKRCGFVMQLPVPAGVTADA